VRDLLHGLEAFYIFFSDPDPMGLTVDQEKGGGVSHGGPRRAGGGVGDGAGVGGGIQEETDPTGIVVPASAAVPIELCLQLEEASLVGLKLVEKGHSVTTSVLMTAHPAHDD
jgi:hypothetical protein